ncbi:antibiotic biosynthesis monooxygenase [Altererythrobacter sp. FM1]|uniref:antibiotic biosynthesis monooxygenase family protein n=1 Tax=Tsuneonella flava TaxID=2055955 RepID=UPI000C7FEE9B|nr:antibiotic biosynthesis monooxygenase family protein [Tsuneonella flava]ROT97339.1 antibiotic biosynthesis monooxygenase [Altererythrobacter sp. FM1]
MITEIVEIRIKPKMQDEFIAGVEKSKELFERSPGFQNLELHRQIEDPEIFLLFINWDSVSHHMDMFRKSPEYQEWRGNVGHFFADTPRLQHSETQLAY